MVTMGEKQQQAPQKLMIPSKKNKENLSTNVSIPSNLQQLSKRVKLKVADSKDMTAYPASVKPILRFVF